MKKNHLLKTTTLLALIILCFGSINAQVRIFKLDPATNSVTLKNFGSTDDDISGLWFCNFPDYAEVSSMTSETTLIPGEEIVITSSIDFAEADGEFGLYNTDNFGSSSAMDDYMQWGTANHQRESVAVDAGLWDANTFIELAPLYEYTGDGTQNGVTFWNSTLNTNNFKQQIKLKLYPNPTNSVINLELERVDSDGTLEIYDMQGKLVLTETVSTNQVSQINISNWRAGMYLVKISSGNSTETKSFIKQ